MSRGETALFFGDQSTVVKNNDAHSIGYIMIVLDGSLKRRKWTYSRSNETQRSFSK